MAALQNFVNLAMEALLTLQRITSIGNVEHSCLLTFSKCVLSAACKFC